MSELSPHLRHHSQSSTDERRTMLPETVEYIHAAIDALSLADPARMNTLVQRMGESERMDGWQATKELTDSLGDAHDLYWGDLGLLRVCLGNDRLRAAVQRQSRNH